MKINFKKCKLCGNVIWTLNDKDIKCCNEDMIDLEANSVEASFEKHIPNYEINNNKMTISVNHVMEEKHYIMWIMMVSDSLVYFKKFNPLDEAKVTFDYNGPCTIYSYCNLHELWSINVD